MKTTMLIGCLAVAVVAGGCGGSSATPPSAKTSTSRAASDPTASLNMAVRDALQKNYELSGYVLWHNSVPASAKQSTRGPALAALQASAVQRRKSGIRIKPITGRLAIVSVSIDPSFAKATATTVASGRVRPYEGSKAESRTISVHERARVQLRRLGTAKKFVVWKVTVLP
jgi:hypothetical protein